MTGSGNPGSKPRFHFYIRIVFQESSRLLGQCTDFTSVRFPGDPVEPRGEKEKNPKKRGRSSGLIII